MSCDNDNNSAEQQNCNLGPFERNRYFYGKLMTVRDFKAEQDYFNEKRHMLNRLIHGVGIVCGLEVSNINSNDNKLTIDITKGAAIDCCGREIVIPDDLRSLVVEGTLSGDKNYLYLKYHEEPTEKVPSVSNPSACEDVCCDNRVRETYKFIVNQIAPVSEVPVLKGKIRETNSIDIAQNYYKDHLSTCPACTDSKVMLAVVESGKVNKDDTFKYRSIVYDNPMIYELLGNHMTDFDNPHQVTAAQTMALVSIEGVSNPGGGVDLVPANSIIINSDQNIKSITIGESHSAKTGNPHSVNHREIKPFGWDKNEIQETTSDNDGVRNKHISCNDADGWNKSIKKITLIQGDSETNIEASGGAISIKAGNNVSLSLVDENTFSISSTAIPETSKYFEKDIELSNDLPTNIPHGLGKFPVVDVYELVEDMWIGKNQQEAKIFQEKSNIEGEIMLLSNYLESKDINGPTIGTIDEFTQHLAKKQIKVTFSKTVNDKFNNISNDNWESFLNLGVFKSKPYYIKSLVTRTPQIDVIHRDNNNTKLVNRSGTTLIVKVIMCIGYEGK